MQNVSNYSKFVCPFTWQTLINRKLGCYDSIGTDSNKLEKWWNWGKTFKEVLAVNWTIDEPLIATSNWQRQIETGVSCSPFLQLNVHYTVNIQRKHSGVAVAASECSYSIYSIYSLTKYAFQVALQSQQQMVRAAFGHSRVQVLTAVIGELATSEGYPRLAKSIVSSISCSERQQCKLRQPALPIDDSSRGKWTVTHLRRKGGGSIRQGATPQSSPTPPLSARARSLIWIQCWFASRKYVNYVVIKSQ